AVVTGVGAVLTAARVPAGARVAVIGAGGVGLNVVQGAAISKADRIIAIDRRPAPLALARAFGAPAAIGAAASLPDAVRTVTRTYALDDVNQALDALAAGEGARGVIKMEG